MKKIIFTLIFCLNAAWPSFAQNNMEAMRYLTVNAMMQYGQKLYERGDYNGASAVFSRVLTYDGRQLAALHYLKNMGHAMTPVAVSKETDFADTRSLKEAIEAKKRSIAQLEVQIKQMRTAMVIQ